MKGVDVVHTVYLLWKGRPERSKHVTDNSRQRSDEVMTSQTVGAFDLKQHCAE